MPAPDTPALSMPAPGNYLLSPNREPRTDTQMPKAHGIGAVRPDPGNRIYFRAFGTSIERRRRRLHRTEDLCGQQLSHSESWRNQYSAGRTRVANVYVP